MQYNPAFIAQRPILSEEDKGCLHALSAQYPLERFRKSPRNYEETLVDFAYTSAKIEGNTYDRIDTDNLLRLGITAGGKRYSDAIMLVKARSSANTTQELLQKRSDKEFLMTSGDFPLYFSSNMNKHRAIRITGLCSKSADSIKNLSWALMTEEIYYKIYHTCLIKF